MTQRRGPAATGRDTSTSTNAERYFTPAWRQDWHDPLTVEDRADLAVLTAAAQRGFRLATRCTRCGQWLVAPTSVRAHLGPVCRVKVAADV
jgi:hypothetical protein